MLSSRIKIWNRSCVVLWFDDTLAWVCYCYRKVTWDNKIKIIIIIIIIIISFMQDIYTYIPETNHVPREYSV